MSRIISIIIKLIDRLGATDRDSGENKGSLRRPGGKVGGLWDTSASKMQT